MAKGGFHLFQGGVGSSLCLLLFSFNPLLVCSVFLFPFLQGDFSVSLVLLFQVVSSFGPSIGMLSMVLN